MRDRLEAVLAELPALMAQHQVPGMAAAVINGDETPYLAGFGVTSAEPAHALPITPETLFRVGSITKPMTGTLMMRLVQQGLLGWDVPLSHYLPDLKLSDNAHDQITLRQLLSHTAGFPSDLAYFDRRQTRPYSSDLAQYVYEVVPRYPFIAPPNTVYFYSNIGINLAGYLAEVVTGTSYQQLMQSLVFDAAGMRHATFDIATALTYPLAMGHNLNDALQAVVKRPFIDNPCEHPCGFAMATAHDMAQFMRLHLTDETLQPLHETQVDRLNHQGYGLTFRNRQFAGWHLVGHYGAIGKFGGMMMLSLEHHIGVTLLFNRAPGFWNVAQGVLDRCFEALLPPSPQPAPALSAPVSPPQSAYLGETVGYVEVSATGDIVINGVNKPEAIAGQVADTAFIMVDGEPCQQTQRTLIRAPDVATFAPLLGCYEADIDRWWVRVIDGQLYLYSEDDHEQLPCLLLDDGTFVCDWGTLVFVYDAPDAQPVALVNAGGYRFNRVD